MGWDKQVRLRAFPTRIAEEKGRLPLEAEHGQEHPRQPNQGARNGQEEEFRVQLEDWLSYAKEGQEWDRERKEVENGALEEGTATKSTEGCHAAWGVKEEDYRVLRS